MYLHLLYILYLSYTFTCWKRRLHEYMPSLVVLSLLERIFSWLACDWSIFSFFPFLVLTRAWYSVVLCLELVTLSLFQALMLSLLASSRHWCFTVLATTMSSLPKYCCCTVFQPRCFDEPVSRLVVTIWWTSFPTGGSNLMNHFPDWW
jgi:hypothetical protein